MEVTRKNFKQTLPLVAESIDRADFLVIDAEFTGLINGRDVSMFDSPEEYYTTLYNGSTDFLLIQYGLCAFYWDEKSKQYMNDAYNFYLFPRGRPGPERMFLCQSSSLDFLAAQGFDFNKVIKEGISYMTETTESRLREHLTERQKLYSSEQSAILIPDENKPQIETICTKVRQFLDKNEENEMEIDRCNAFIRRLLFQELGTRFKNEAFVETKILENQNRVLKVTRVTSESDGKSRDTLKKEKEWEEFEDAVGFSKVARMISQSEKLVVGHNMLLDILHTLNHFFQPLPYDYGSFKEFAHCMFPRLLDTKYMSSLPPFKDKVNSSVLHHLLATLSEPPFSLPTAASKDGRGYSQSDEKHHEAGYDAYVTGLCFLSMHAHLSRMRGDGDLRVCAGAGGDSAALKPFLNKLFLAKTAHQDSPYINLSGPDPNPSRDHVFHLTFPKDWQRNEINQLFSPFGQISVQFLDETSALVALSRREQARDVKRTLAGNERVQLVPYLRYKNLPSKVHKESENSRQSSLPLLSTNSPEVKPRLTSSSSSSASAKLPERVDRPRANSLSSPSTPASPTPQHTRKRTSSGVFQVDDAEPPPKKAELLMSAPADEKKKETSQKINLVVNGRSKEEIKTKEKEQIDKKLVDKKSVDKKSESKMVAERKGIDKIGSEKKGDKKGLHQNASEKRSDKKMIEKFDESAKSSCLPAFKESDSWD